MLMDECTYIRVVAPVFACSLYADLKSGPDQFLI